MKTQEQIYREDYAKLERMLTSNPTTQPEELALLQAVKRDELKAMPLIDKAASLGLAGDPAGAIVVLVQEARAPQASWLKELAALTALETRLSERRPTRRCEPRPRCRRRPWARPRWRWPWADWRHG